MFLIYVSIKLCKIDINLSQRQHANNAEAAEFLIMNGQQIHHRVGVRGALSDASRRGGELCANSPKQRENHELENEGELKQKAHRGRIIESI